MRSFLDSIFRDATRISGVAIAVLLVAWAIALLRPPAYTAAARLLVLGSDEYASRPATLSPQAAPPAALLTRDAILSAEMSILTSQPVIRSTVEAIGVAQLYPDLAQPASGFLGRLLSSGQAAAPVDRAVRRFAAKLQLKPDRSGSTIEVAFTHPQPQRAAEAVNRLLAQYQARRLAIYGSAESPVVEAAVQQSREQLDGLSRQLSEFESRNGISKFEIQMDLLLRRLAEHSGMLQAAQAESAEVDKRLASLRQQLQSTPREIVQYQDTESDRRVQTMRDQLADLRRQEAELLQTYTEGSERVSTIRRQIRAMEQEVANGSTATRPTGVRRGVNEVRTAIELDLVRATSQANATGQRRQELSAQVNAIRAEIAALQGKRGELEDLSRRKSLAEQEFLGATRALQERRSMEDFGAKRAANVRTVEAAEAPNRPDRTRLLILVAGAFLALVAAVATALLLHRLRRTYLDAGTLQADTRLPVLASIAELGRPHPVLTLGA